MEIRLSQDAVCELNFQYRYDKARQYLRTDPERARFWLERALKETDDIDDRELRDRLRAMVKEIVLTTENATEFSVRIRLYTLEEHAAPTLVERSKAVT